MARGKRKGGRERDTEREREIDRQTERESMGGSFKATVGFQNSDIFQTEKKVLRYISNVNFHLLGFKL